MPNARLSERAPFFAEVDVVAAGLPAPRRLWGSDVSETGIFLQTTQPFRIGDRVSLRFDIEANEVHVRAAEVMWVRPFEPVAVDGRLPGVGLRFVAVDPPARAALRKFVAPALSDTQPESMPSQLPPPRASLPPVTGSILATTGKRHEVTDEMFAVSLPPFSQPPLNISLPEDEPIGMPEEVRVFKQTRPFGAPKPVTIGPKPTSTPPAFLMGWKFRKDEPEAPQFDEKMRFDDTPPGGVHEPSAQIFDVTSGPPEGVSRDEQEAAPMMLKELEDGVISVRHLPIVEERRTAPSKKPPNRALPVALALLCAGTLFGSGIGLVGKKWQARHAKGAIATKHVVPASGGTASLSPSTTSTREVTAMSPSLASSPAPATTAPSATATTAPSAMAAPSLAAAAPPLAAPASTTPAPTASTSASSSSLAVSTKSAAPSNPAPRSVSEVERELPKATSMDDAGVTFASTIPTKHSGGHETSVRVGNASVTKAFALTGPSRVVVDLDGGKLPKGTLEDRGIRVRFGHPAKGTGRVVIELADDKKAKDVTASVTGGLLTVSWR